MMAASLCRTCVLSACLAWSGGTLGLAAQDAGRQRDIPTPRLATPTDLTEADALLAEATRLEQTPDPSSWLRAASLHIRSAQHRPLGDERVFRCLFRAAQILRALGRVEAAQKTLEQSATHARLYGDIEREAEALMGAGWLAAKRRDTAAMNRLLSRAYLLTYSPVLPDELRQEVRRRVLLPVAPRAVTVAALY